MNSEAYTDVVGSLARPTWPPAYNEAITEPCPNCGARPYTVCTQPKTDTPRRMPCVARVTNP
jgi:hypothetical protein